jgi:hypothetical protein
MGGPVRSILWTCRRSASTGSVYNADDRHCRAAWKHLPRDAGYRLNPCHVVLDQHAKSSMLMDMDKSLKIHSARYAKRISSMLLGTAE